MAKTDPRYDHAVIWDEDILTGRWAVFRDRPAHGWVEWLGGPPPFRSGEVDVRLRSGRLILYRSVVGIGGRANPGGNWVHLGEQGDIIAYRRHEPPDYPGGKDTPLPF